MEDYKTIRDKFLDHQQHYLEITGDIYEASQMAANATERDFGITREQLIDKLNG